MRGITGDFGEVKQGSRDWRKKGGSKGKREGVITSLPHLTRMVR